MINPAAVRAFLDRPRANSDKAKRFTDAALDRMLARLNPPPRFVFPPYWHQKIAFLLGLKYGSYLFLLDMGLGKTKVVLDLFRYRRRLKQSRRLLVLVPNTANIGGWEEEARVHTPHLTFLGLDERYVGDARREAILRTDANIVAVTYHGWAQLVTSPKRVERHGEERNKWAIDKKKARDLERRFDEVVFDESNTIQNSRSLYFRMAKRFIKVARFRSCLTGTPFNKDPIALWGQFYVVDQGATLGVHLGLFRQAFFIEKKAYWGGGFKYEFDPRMEEDLYAMLRHRSVRFSEEECLDLPPKIGGLERPVIRSVVMPRETWDHYQGLVEELKATRGNYSLMESAYMRLRMLCSGYLPMKDEDGNRTDVPLPQNPKLDALVALLREIPSDKKVIVFHWYRATGALIAARFVKEKISHVRLFGGTSNKSEAIARFKTDPKCRILLASSAGARGHNLQVAHHMAIFESPDSLDARKQLEKRIRRPGQEHPTHYYDLQVKSSIDQQILASLQAGRRLFDALVDGTEDLGLLGCRVCVAGRSKKQHVAR